MQKKIGRRQAKTIVLVVALSIALIIAFSCLQAAYRPTGNAQPGPLQPAATPLYAQPSAVPSENISCIISVEQRTVRGNSMTGLLADGDNITVQFGYYGCNVPARGDIALVRYAGDSSPIVKAIMAVPGDTFGLSPAYGGWNIVVNGQVLQNSEGKDYCISEQGARMITVYVKSYGGKIPAGAYLVLGNLVTGTTDSTKFGLVARENLMGKVKTG
jgi:signal peptidase I